MIINEDVESKKNWRLKEIESKGRRKTFSEIYLCNKKGSRKKKTEKKIKNKEEEEKVGDADA